MTFSRDVSRGVLLQQLQSYEETQKRKKQENTRAVDVQLADATTTAVRYGLDGARETSYLVLLFYPFPTLFPTPNFLCAPFAERFKTKAGRDLAIKRSGEALGSYCSWWDPENVAVVVRGRDQDRDYGFGSGDVLGGAEGVNDLLLVLPYGRSVADVLEKVGRLCYLTFDSCG